MDPTKVRVIPETNQRITLLSLTYVESFIKIEAMVQELYRVTNRQTNRQTYFLQNRRVKTCSPACLGTYFS